jgi:hypothetical protein
MKTSILLLLIASASAQQMTGMAMSDAPSDMPSMAPTMTGGGTGGTGGTGGSGTGTGGTRGISASGAGSQKCLAFGALAAAAGAYLMQN